MNDGIQDMMVMRSLMEFSCKDNRARSYIDLKSPRRKCKPKPYEQMTHPGERVQIDVKVVPRSCLADPSERLFQYTAIDEYSRLRYLGAYQEQSTYSSADFLQKAVVWFRVYKPLLKQQTRYPDTV